MSAPAPVQSFLGGLSIPIPVHALLLLNGNVMGISGFIHRAARGCHESLTAVIGFILGGAAISLIDGSAPQSAGIPLSHLAASGFLVGLGTRLGNGCTSGHMICGVSRFSLRSIIATAVFFTTGVITAHITHGSLNATAPFDWSLGGSSRKLLVAQVVPFAVSVLLYFFAARSTPEKAAAEEADARTPLKKAATAKHIPYSRYIAFLSTTTQFALGLQLSGLTSPDHVVRFLLLPFHRGFDPSLAFLAVGAIPLATTLYHYARGNEIPCLGGKWGIPKGGDIDVKLIAGAAIFGVGWGWAGICPGPGLVNFGRALMHNEGQLPATALWLASVTAGGLLA